MCLCEQLCVHVYPCVCECECISVCVCMCVCLCLWGSSQTRGRYHQLWPEVSQRWWNTETHKAQKKLPQGTISVIGDGRGLYMSSNNWEPKSCIYLDAFQCITLHCFAVIFNVSMSFLSKLAIVLFQHILTSSPVLYFFFWIKGR